jgi:hypothetical protein
MEKASMINICELEKDLTDVSDRELALVSGGADPLTGRVGIAFTPKDLSILIKGITNTLIVTAEVPPNITGFDSTGFSTIFPINPNI